MGFFGMGKVISKAMATEPNHETAQEPKDEFCLDVRGGKINAKTGEFTRMGYDNETGLWEEQEHGNRQSKLYEFRLPNHRTPKLDAAVTQKDNPKMAN
jgi:hypothetical protein